MSKGNVRVLAEELIKVLEGDTHEFAYASICRLRKLAAWGEGSVDYATLAKSTSTMISAFEVGEGKEVADIGDLLMAARALSVVDLWRDSAALYAQAVGSMIRKAANEDRVVAEIAIYRAVPSLIEAALSEEDVKKWWAFRNLNTTEEVTIEDATTEPRKEGDRNNKEKSFIFGQHEVRQILSQEAIVFRRLAKPFRGGWNHQKHRVAALALSRNMREKGDLEIVLAHCPVVAGDTVVVREGFRIDSLNRTVYKAGASEIEVSTNRWKAPTAMPKSRARLRFEITSVTVEQIGKFDPKGNPLHRDEAHSQADYIRKWATATGKDFDPTAWVYRIEGKLIK
jgi:hypothetical protein